MPENGFWPTLSVIALAIIGTASLAVLVSRNANTTGVITSTGTVFSNALSVALSPVTGGGTAFSGSAAFPIT
jgi:hypothetical protein